MHTDPELLSLFALGEHVGAEDDRAHADTCPACNRELSELHRLVALGRSISAGTELVTPSQNVWARIRDELALGPTLEPPTLPPILLPPGTPKFENELTAHAQLTPVEGFWSRASGQAELATDEQGRRLLQVALQADLPTSGLRQAWLVHRDNPNLRQSLGILDGRHGLWTVDHSIDLEKHGILDISQQAAGETDHSGQTIVRGELMLVG